MQGGTSRMAPPILAYRFTASTYPTHEAQNPMSSYGKGAQGLSVFLRVHGIFTADCNFTESLAETVWRSLRHSCRSELTDKEFRCTLGPL